MEEKNDRPGQLNFNTFLLTGCLALSGWILYSINDLDEKMSAQAVIINTDHEAIFGNNGIDKVINDQSKTIQSLSERMVKLEIIQNQKR